MNDITYRVNLPLHVSEMIELYRHCSLGARRPTEEPERMQKMLDNANLVITAWSQDKLVGIARCLTDFTYTTYLADLAVHDDFQKQGIGQQLIKEVQNNTEKHCRIVLLAAPAAVDYYPHIGFTAHSSAWTLLKDE
ncbi:GNAT family N-acetyltransferase [Zophobihabitans entericus]|uniref:GNAT family N-acetyltransferase n=2 Tax=Zophobihabitans entericus TaxID=1635327 RepID=A0A6G9IDU2_9GAMM|nr:GNAT family N-acetyltransferase [Zophobihabitans entericus]